MNAGVTPNDAIHTGNSGENGHSPGVAGAAWAAFHVPLLLLTASIGANQAFAQRIIHSLCGRGEAAFARQTTAAHGLIRRERPAGETYDETMYIDQ